jgi:hypothetical protein
MGRFALKMEASVTGEWNEMLLENPALLATQLKANLDASVPRNVVVSALQQKMRNAILAQAAASEMEMSEEELENAVNRSVEQQLGPPRATSARTGNSWRAAWPTTPASSPSTPWTPRR